METISKKQIYFHGTLSYLLYLFVFLLPWQTRWIFQDSIVGKIAFEYGRMSLYLFDIILIAIILIFFLGRSFGVKFNFCLSKAEGIGVVLVMALIAVMAYSSFFWSYNQDITNYWLARFVLAFFLFMLVWKINFSTVKMIVVLAVSASIQAVLGVWQVITNRVFESKWLGMALQKATAMNGESVIEVAGERMLRAYGSLPHPNILAGFLVVAFALIIYLILKTEEKYQRLFLFSSFSMLLIGIFLTFSRSAWIITVILIIFFFSVFSRKSTYDTRRLSRALGAWAFILLAILTIAFWQPVKTRIAGQSKLEKISTQERTTSLRDAYHIAQNNFPVGVGLGNYTHELRRLDRVPKAIYTYQPVHNVYMLTWVELGLAGAIVIFLLVMYFVARIVATKELQYTGFPLPVLIIGSALGSVYLLMLFDHYFWTTAFGIYLWFLVMALFVKNIGQHQKEVLPKIQTEAEK